MYNSCFLQQGVCNQSKCLQTHYSHWLLTSDILQGDCYTSSHFSRIAEGPVPQLFISSNSCRPITNKNYKCDVPPSKTIKYGQNNFNNNDVDNNNDVILMYIRTWWVKNRFTVLMYV